MRKKLYRSKNDKKLLGVCGGVACYFEIDSTIIRLIWLIAILFWGTGFLIYFICAFVMPTEKDEPIEYEYIHRKEDNVHQL